MVYRDLSRRIWAASDLTLILVVILVNTEFCRVASLVIMKKKAGL